MPVLRARKSLKPESRGSGIAADIVFISGLRHRPLQGAPLLQGKEPVEIVDQHHSVPQLDHAVHVLDAGNDLPRRHPHALVVFNDAVHGIDGRRHRAPRRAGDDELIGRRRFASREVEPPADVDNWDDPPAQVDHTGDDVRRLRQARDLNGADDPLDRGQMQRVPLAIEDENDKCGRSVHGGRQSGGPGVCSGPANREWMSGGRSATRLSLVMKPSAPAAVALARYSTAVCRVSMMIFGAPASRLIRRVASRPLIPGMTTSIRIKSGFRAAVRSMASAPDAAQPTTSRYGWLIKKFLAALLKAGLSSTSRTRMVFTPQAASEEDCPPKRRAGKSGETEGRAAKNPSRMPKKSVQGFFSHAKQKARFLLCFIFQSLGAIEKRVFQQPAGRTCSHHPPMPSGPRRWMDFMPRHGAGEGPMTPAAPGRRARRNGPARQGRGCSAAP